MNAWQFEQAMKLSGISKTTMAERMHANRAAQARLPDENDTSLTLETPSRSAQALGCRVKDAAAIVDRVVRAVRSWRGTFERLGVSPRDCDRVASAFRRASDIGMREVERRL